jgi:hypothetical protein
MRKKVWLIAYSIISLAFFMAFAYTSVKDMLSVGTYYNWAICYSASALIILVLLVSSYSFLNESHGAPLRYFPIAINYSTTIFAIVIIITSSVFDLAFLAHQRDFSQVIKLANEGELYTSEFGRVKLPAKYQHLSNNKDIIIIRKNESISVMFFDGVDSLDGLSWGFLYSSEPDKPVDGEMAKCVQWRKLRPNIQHWFYCEYFVANFNL